MTQATTGGRGVSRRRVAASGAAALAVPAAVLALGFLLGTPKADADSVPAPGAARNLPERAVAASDEIVLGDDMQIWGRPAQMSVFWTADSPEEVLRTYIDAWTSAGFVPRTQVVDRVASASFVDPATGILRAVTALRQDDQTLVIPSSMDVRVMPDVSARSAPVPVPVTAKAFMAHSTDEAGVAAWTGSYLVPLAPERAVAFYRVEMAKLGYRENTDEALSRAKGVAGAEFERGPENITVVATPTEDKRDDGKIASFVMVTHTRRIPAEDAR